MNVFEYKALKESCYIVPNAKYLAAEMTLNLLSVTDSENVYEMAEIWAEEMAANGYNLSECSWDDIYYIYESLAAKTSINLSEDTSAGFVEKIIVRLRTLYKSGKAMTFKQWLEVFAKAIS